MLPSMPCLNFCENSCDIYSQTNNVEIVEPSEASKEVKSCEDFPDENCQYDSHCSNEYEKFKLENTVIESNNDDKDNIDEINAIMIASSTVKNVREKKEVTLVNKKKAKRRKQYLAAVSMLLPPDPLDEKYKLENFAQTYFEKLEETLETDDYNRVKEIFQSIDENDNNTIDLYSKLKPILIPKYQDLADEFLLFLNVEQAKAVGNLVPFFIINHMAKFLRNLDCYFKDQPSQLRKIHKCLLDLNDSNSVSLEKVKSTVLPLLRSNSLLCDGFLQIFLEEKPTATLLNGAWEVIDLSKELGMTDDESLPESITVADIEESNCVCPCHKTDELQPSRNHCLKCGLRFVQGKMYCQTGKGLRPVNVTFPTNLGVDHSKRLGLQNKTKRIDLGSMKNCISPTKEGTDENRLTNEAEEDYRKKNLKRCKSVKRVKTQRKKIFISKVNKSWDIKNDNEKSSVVKSPSRRIPTKLIPSTSVVDDGKITNKDKTDLVHKTKPSCSSEQLKSQTDICWTNLPSPEYLDVHSSDSDFSFDDFTKTNSTKLNCSDKTDEGSCDLWTREEDKIILETFQQKFDQEAIQLIAKRLKNRSVHEISARFERLMVLLHEMET